MSAREVLRLLLQIAEDMNGVLGLPSAFRNGKFSFPKENEGDRQQRVEEICKSLLGDGDGWDSRKKKVEGMITALFRHYSRLREFYYNSGLSVLSPKTEVQVRMETLHDIIMGAWTLSEMWRMVLQSNKLEPMQQHVEELEKYLGIFGYDRTVMSGSRGAQPEQIKVPAAVDINSMLALLQLEAHSPSQDDASVSADATEPVYMD